MEGLAIQAVVVGKNGSGKLTLIDNKAPDEVMRAQLSNIHYIQFTKENRFYQGKE